MDATTTGLHAAPRGDSDRGEAQHALGVDIGDAEAPQAIGGDDLGGPVAAVGVDRGEAGGDLDGDRRASGGVALDDPGTARAGAVLAGLPLDDTQTGDDVAGRALRGVPLALVAAARRARGTIGEAAPLYEDKRLLARLVEEAARATAGVLRPRQDRITAIELGHQRCRIAQAAGRIYDDDAGLFPLLGVLAASDTPEGRALVAVDGGEGGGVVAGRLGVHGDEQRVGQRRDRARARSGRAAAGDDEGGEEEREQARHAATLGRGDPARKLPAARGTHGAGGEGKSGSVDGLGVAEPPPSGIVRPPSAVVITIERSQLSRSTQ